MNKNGDLPFWVLYSLLKKTCKDFEMATRVSKVEGVRSDATIFALGSCTFFSIFFEGALICQRKEYATLAKAKGQIVEQKVIANFDL